MEHLSDDVLETMTKHQLYTYVKNTGIKYNLKYVGSTTKDWLKLAKSQEVNLLFEEIERELETALKNQKELEEQKTFEFTLHDEETKIKRSILDKATTK